MKKHISVAILVCLFSFISCNNEEIGEVQEQFQTHAEGEIIRFDNGLTVQYKDGKYFWQGDIILSQQQVDEMSSSTRGVGLNSAYSRYRWSDKTVPYKFATGHFNQSQQAIIRNALDQFNTRTCVRVRETTSADRDYVLIVREEEPYACYGRQGGEQKLSLNDNQWGTSLIPGKICMYMLHTFGILKEINRPDRDEYVRINWPNLMENKIPELEKYTWSCVTDFGVAFDYNSVTMPDKYDSSVNGLIVFSPIHDPNQSLGNSQGLSEGDIHTLNRMYGCE